MRNVPAPLSSLRIWDQSKIDTPRLKRLLLDMGTVDSEPADDYLPESYDISDAMYELNGRGDIAQDEMVGLEFMYIQILDHSKYGVPNIEQWISESPIGFVQTLAMPLQA